MNKTYSLAAIVLLWGCSAGWQPLAGSGPSAVLATNLRHLAEDEPFGEVNGPNDDPALSKITPLLESVTDPQELEAAILACYKRLGEVSAGCDGYCAVAFRYAMAIDCCVGRLGELKTSQAAECLVRLYADETFNWGANTREEFHAAICGQGRLSLPYLRRAVAAHPDLKGLLGVVERGGNCSH